MSPKLGRVTWVEEIGLEVILLHAWFMLQLKKKKKKKSSSMVFRKSLSYWSISRRCISRTTCIKKRKMIKEKSRGNINMKETSRGEKNEGDYKVVARKKRERWEINERRVFFCFYSMLALEAIFPFHFRDVMKAVLGEVKRTGQKHRWPLSQPDLSSRANTVFVFLFVLCLVLLSRI